MGYIGQCRREAARQVKDRMTGFMAEAAPHFAE
jgi:hypothetical protein